jgi:hypothetical protein
MNINTYPRVNTTRKIKQISKYSLPLKGKSFQSVNTRRKWRINYNVGKYLHRLKKKKEILEEFADIYTESQDTNVILFSIFAERMSEYFQKIHRNVRNYPQNTTDPFNILLDKYIVKHNLNKEDEDLKEYMERCISFIEWLQDLSKRKPELKKDIDLYVKGLLTVFDGIFDEWNKHLDFVPPDSEIDELTRLLGRL